LKHDETIHSKLVVILSFYDYIFKHHYYYVMFFCYYPDTFST